MIDPIKKFVEENRAEFDHMEPPAHVLQQIKSRLKDSKELQEEKKTVPFFNRKIWFAAAAVLIAVSTVYIFNTNSTVEGNLEQMAHQSAPKVDTENTDQPGDSGSAVTLSQSDLVAEPGDETLKPARVVKSGGASPQTRAANMLANQNNKPISLPKDLYARLGDSSSASARLAAVLAIEKAGDADRHTLDRLARTLNNDGNSNVRLAALGVIGQHVNNEYASSILVRSLSSQEDPMVQLELVGLLGNLKNTKVDARLIALADDPKTFSAVKDQAYTLLLNKNKI
ncbi:HEAT repeat domain-containing protein [Pedobacter antarcticus]|uniref:HEAT repeat domain-containing protein n=1 Tax=Pedobacter antarcticus TaxID=34086 RepID=UPI001C57E782|nr:HEAT repeat domain-containing protein [Pedobacter antarcticus]